MLPNKFDQKTGCGNTHLSWLGALWTSPNTLIGILFALCSWSIPKLSQGIFVAEGNRGLAKIFLAKRGFSAIAFGQVVITVIPLDARLRMHEEHHVKQYEILGPFFLPAYLLLALFYGYKKHPMEMAAADCEMRFIMKSQS